MNNYHAVLFDAGNTLWRWDTINPWVEGLASQGINRSVDEIRAAEEATRKVFQPQWDHFDPSGRPTDPATLKRFWLAFNEYKLRLLRIGERAERLAHAAETIWFERAVHLYPETGAVLEALKAAGYLMAIVSNGSDQQRLARHLGIDGFFATIIGSSHVGFKKPHPRIYQLALSRLGVGPHHVLMVGDDVEADVLGPERLGITGIHLVRDGAASSHPRAVSNLQGLIELLAAA